ncbi:MAG: chemotaxis protein CheD [bacterium]
MGNIIVGVGGIGVSNNPSDLIKTFALGSCVAIVVIDALTKTTGMVHIALPDSAVDPKKGKELPGYFTDTGIPALFRLMKGKGALKVEKMMIVKLAGGAKIMDPNSIFDIGKRNILAIKKFLWAKGLGPVAEDVGGSHSRTVTVKVDTGEMLISSYGWEDLVL